MKSLLISETIQEEAEEMSPFVRGGIRNDAALHCSQKPPFTQPLPFTIVLGGLPVPVKIRIVTGEYVV